ncbi:MAG: transposase [Muribaculaceae bacterium]|nr:transposase [Muribaculaceae bacterium]
MDDKRNEGRKQWARKHPDVTATPSMKRRMADHDYQSRAVYLVTLCVEGRIARLGSLCGPDDCHPLPWVSLTALGKRVEAEWMGIPRYYPEIHVLALTVMPDHLHGILFVSQPLPVHLGKVINGFKTGCNRAARELGLPVPLWEQGYTDGVLRGKGQLDRWKQYLNDNPRRLWTKRQHHGFFTVSRHLTVAGHTVSAMGNHELLRHPSILQVYCSRRMSDEEIAREGDRLLGQDAVLVSPAISPGERAIMTRAIETGTPVILICDNGFSDLSKPGGRLFDACAAGKVLMVSLHEHRNDYQPLTAAGCREMNALARAIATRR